MADRKTRIVVLGAGLQGACVALEAAQRGHPVCLVDRAPRCLDRASLRNEGKIHLGFVYAKDAGFETADLMLRSALTFAPLLDKWMPDRFDWPGMRSTPFLYLVARDTLVPTDRLFEHYDRVEARCRALQEQDPGLHYLGERLDRLWSEQAVPPFLDPARIGAVASTPEASIDLAALQRGIAAALASDARIEMLYGHTVEHAARASHGFTVAGTRRDGSPWSRDAGCVVNSLWDGRLEIDAQMGLHPDRPWVYRFKHRVVGRTPPALAHLPSLTMVLGAFGDVVTRPHDDALYLSWYPVCQTGWSQELAPPAAWQAAASGGLALREQEPIIRDTLAAFDTIVPGLGAVRGARADGGVIFAWGASDIDDEASELHQRHRIGVTADDGYFSINTGKLTSAPYFAAQLAGMLP